MTTVLKSRNQVLIKNCNVARSFFSRFMGLMGRKSIADDEAILFPRCNSVHTFFMRFPIDVVRIDDAGLVLGVDEMKPWRMMAPNFQTKHIAELKAGHARKVGITPGVVLQVEGMFE